jgi:hypothetical protein
MNRIIKSYFASNKTEEQPSTIDVSLVKIAPILIVLAAGYVIGIFVLLIEQFAHGNIFHYCPRGNFRRWRQNEY